MVYDLKHFLLWKLPKLVNVFFILKEFVEPIGEWPVQVVETLYLGHDRRESSKAGWRHSENRLSGRRVFGVRGTSKSRGGGGCWCTHRSQNANQRVLGAGCTCDCHRGSSGMNWASVSWKWLKRFLAVTLMDRVHRVQTLGKLPIILEEEQDPKIRPTSPMESRSQLAQSFCFAKANCSTSSTRPRC